MKIPYNFVCISFSCSNFENNIYEKYLHPYEYEKIKRALDKRKIEFLSGRLCAKIAYSKLYGTNIYDSGLYVMNDAHGAPFFPDGSSFVSITHDDGIAAAIVTDKHQLCAGIDVQRISPKNTKIIYEFLEANEKTFFNKNNAKYGGDFLASSIWVAKEALSKLLMYGFSVYDALEISEIENGEELIVKFKNLSRFQVLLRTHKDYLFGFAALENQIENFYSNHLQITDIPIDSLINK